MLISIMTKEQIKLLILCAVQTAQKKGLLPDAGSLDIPIDYPQNAQHGDYSSSVCFVLAKAAKKSPVQVAEIIKLYLEADYLQKVEVVNGYLNFFIKQEFLENNIVEICKEKEKFGHNCLGKGQTLVIDYSSPNIAKAFGIGHLRSTIIGQAIYNLYEFSGWKCVGINHLGDWGSQFGKLIYQIEKNKIPLSDLTVDKLEELYVAFHKDLETNKELENVGKEWFAKLERGDKNALKIWEKCRELSLKEFQRIYKILGVKIDNAIGESFYSKSAHEVIKEAKEKKIGRLSENAYIIEFKDKTVQVLQKSDSSSTYFARDLAALKYRLQNWPANLLVYEVGVDQEQYFKQVFSVAQMLGWAAKEKMVFVGHGLIRTKDGKFSTRKGQTIHLEDVLHEAIERAYELSKETEKEKVLDEKGKRELAEIVGIGALKYNDLSQYHAQDIIFDWDKILNLKGNSGPYIQYTYARAKSVLRRGMWKKYLENNYTLPLLSEREILSLALRFKEVLGRSAKEFSPNILCNYLYSLCQSYNRFYDTCSIASANDEEERRFRLNLSFAVCQIILTSLTILGIQAPEKM